jgi:hypothetical protein
MMAPSSSPDKDKLPAFQRTQLEFAAHIRNPEKNSAPGNIEDRRMGIYRELFFNNVTGFMENSFPVIHSIFDQNDWETMMRDYFERHQAETPYFHKMAEEFLAYLQDERDNPDDPPFLLELAHYEWVELALLLLDDDIDVSQFDPNGEFLDKIPYISPLAWPLAYQFDVHHIGPEYLPDKPADQPTYLVVYRDRDDDVRFVEVNPVTARLLNLLIENDQLTSRQALEQIADELQHSNPDIVIHAGLQALEELKAKGIVLGTRKDNQK